MTTAELEAAIRDIIRNIYCKEYISKLIITELPEGGYSAK